ncbi:MAG: hypothetical protein V5A48_09430 [Salinivenus sp.]
MPKARSVLSVLFLAVLGGALVGCDSSGPDTGGELSAEEARTQVQNTDRDLSENMSQLNSGAFSTTMRGLFLSNGTTTGSKDAHVPLGYVLLDSLDSVLQTADGRLDFEASTGEYTWEGEQAGWTQTGSSDSIVLTFPTSRGASNTATFTLAGYSDTNVVIDGESAYVPEVIAASLTVEGEEIFAVDLTNTEFYDAQLNGTQVLKTALLRVLTAPQRHTFEWSSPSKQEFEFAFDLVEPANDNRLVAGLGATATLRDDVENVSGAGDIDELSGTVRLGPDVTIDYTLQVDELAALGDDPSAQAVNDNLAATMQYRGRTVGDIKVTEEDGPVLVYNDGEEVPLEEAFDDTLSIFTPSGSGSVIAVMTTAADKVQAAVSTVFRP